jgi:hypothetical protein
MPGEVPSARARYGHLTPISRASHYNLQAELPAMLHHLGIFLQICAMTLLPLIILYQLQFGFQLVVMPVLTVIGFAVFWIGTQLREKT